MLFTIIYKQKRILNYYSFKTSSSNYSFKKLIDAVILELDCTNKSVSRNKAILFRRQDVLNGGEDIFIIKEGNQIFINSIRSLKFASSNYSKKRNKENIITVLQNIEILIKGKDVKEVIKKRKKVKDKRFWNESEWTTKKIAMRLLMYPFTILTLIFYLY